MRDFDKTIISQYQNSAILTQLITNLNTYIDPDANLEAFYKNIWNIDTAIGYGLDVWGRIVDINRILQIQSGSFFRFQEANDGTGFNQSPFMVYGQPTTVNFTLTDDAFRLLIFAKAASNITDCSIPAINQILRNLFPGRGNTYVTDGANRIFGTFFGFAEAGDRGPFNDGPFIDRYQVTIPGIMTMMYVFEFVLQPFEISIVNSGVLPKPTGVRATVNIGPLPGPTPAPPSPPQLLPDWPNPHFVGKYTSPNFITVTSSGGRFRLSAGTF
jgi:hypothetical protein